MINLLLLMMFKILNAQIYCKYEGSKLIDQHDDGSKLIDQKSKINNTIYFIQFQVIVEDEDQEFIKIIQDDGKTIEIILKQKEEKFLIGSIKIPFDGIGIWQYIFINSTTQNTNIIWYSNFKLLINQSFKSNINRVKLLQEEYINMEFLQINDIQDVIQQCHKQQQITLKIDPQLSRINFGYFNNKLFKISFWVNFLQDNGVLHINIQRKDQEINEYEYGNDLKINLEQRTLWITSFNLFNVQQDINTNGWAQVTVEQNFYDNYLYSKFYNKYEIYQQYLNLSLFQFQPYLELEIIKPRLVQLTQIQLDLDHFDDTYCIPGCLICQDIICIKCDKDLILKDGECQCKKDIYFSLNECYFPDIEYFTVQIENLTSQITFQQNCPQYDEQMCKNCFNQNYQQEHQFCEYSYKPKDYFSEQYEFFDYQMEDNNYIIDQYITLESKQKIYKTDSLNVLLQHLSIYSIYQLGFYTDTNQKNIQCFENYYGNFCKPKIKNCLIQLNPKLCQQCKDNYHNVQQKCKRCPMNCERCIMEPKNNVKCVKCVNNYFLTLDYKCKQCTLQNCLICYEYDNDQMSLQEFLFKQNDLIKQIGCAQCQSPYFLNLQTRSCQLNNVSFKEELDICQQDDGCLYCQQNLCLMCYRGFFNNKGSCEYEIDLMLQTTPIFQIKSQNPYYNNFNKQSSISTFLYYQYDYSHILKNQEKSIIIGCEFPQIDTKNNHFDCLIRDNFMGVQRSEFQPLLYTFIQFNISFHENRPYLSSYNSFIDPLNYQIYLLQDLQLVNQIIDLTLDYSYDLSFQDQQQIFGSLDFQKIKINYTFQNDQCIILQGSLIIIDSYIKVGNLCIESNEIKGFLEIRNTIFEAANEQAYLTIQSVQPDELTMQNVTFKNFQSEGSIILKFVATKIIISQLFFQNVQSNLILDFEFSILNVSGLEIYNDQPQQTECQFELSSILHSASFIEIKNIRLINCLFQQVFFTALTELIDIKVDDVYLQQSKFDQPLFFIKKAQSIQISNFKAINCTLEKGADNFIYLDAAKIIFIFNFSLINLEIFDQSLIYILSDMGNCYIDNFQINNNQFIFSDINLPLISVQSLNFILNSLLITNSQFDGTLFQIEFKMFANLSNIDINQIINDQTLVKEQLFSIISGKELFIEKFSLCHCIFVNYLFFFNNIFNISINTFRIDNIVINKDYDYFIYLGGSNILIENFIIEDLTVVNQEAFVIEAMIEFDSDQTVHLSFFYLKNIYSFFQTIVKINTHQLVILNLQGDQISEHLVLLDITSSQIAGIQNAIFSSQILKNLIHITNAELAVLHDIFINQSQIIKTIFEFTNCTNLYLDQIYVYPGLRVFNLFKFESQEFKLIKIIGMILQKINIEDSLIDLKNSRGSIQIQDSYFDLVGQEKLKKSLILDNEKFILQNIIIKGIKTDKISIKGYQIYLVNLTILDSQIDNIKIEIQDNDNLYDELFIRGTLNINYIYFTVHNSQRLSQQLSSPFIQLLSPNNIIVMYLVKIVNNKIRTNLIQFDTKIFSQFSEIMLINNECQNNCQDFYGKDYHTNNLFNYHKLDGLDKQYQKRGIIIKINNKLWYNEFLYVPSGQSLKDYKIFDLKNGQSQHYIHKIEITHQLNYQEERLNGNFKIIAYKYSIEHKIISNLTDNVLNFNHFSQTNYYNQLIDLKVTYNPYQDDSCLLLVISHENDTKYERISFLIKTFICQIGEIFRQNKCLQCDTNYDLYSLKQKSNLCSVFDDQIATEFKHNSIKLREGFWRPFIYSHIVEKCNSKYDRCKGGWQTGNHLCKIGYYGGLCDSCDTNNIIGNGYYQMIDNQCKICDNMFKNGQFLMMKLLLIIIIYQIKLYFKSQSTKSLYSKYLLQKLIFHQHFQVINIYLIDLSSIILDTLIQNISITQQILKNQEFNLPEVLGIFTNPIQFINNSTFCFSQYFGVEQYQLTLIFAFLFPFIIYNIFISLSYIIDGLKVKKQYIFIQPIINLLILLGPTLISQFITNLFYAEYSKQRYVLSDLGVRYFSQSHQSFIKYFISPIIISFGIIIPLILMNKIHQLTKRIFKKQIFQTFGSYIFQYNIKFELILNYYLTSLLLTLFQINQTNFLTAKDLISIIVLVFALKKTYKIKKFNKILLKSWICIGMVTYITKVEQQVIDSFILQMCISSFIILYIFFKYIMQLIMAYDQQILEFIQLRRKLSSYFMTRILYNEKQYWKLINQLVKLHKLKFVQDKQSNERVFSQTVLKKYGQNYHNLRTLKTEPNEGIEMQQL